MSQPGHSLPAEAERANRIALELQPTAQRPAMQLATMLADQGRAGEARAVLEAFLASRSDILQPVSDLLRRIGAGKPPKP